MTTRRTGRLGVVAIFVVLASWVGLAAAQEPGAKPAAGETRTWTDITGKFSREAEFLKLEEGQVHLRLKGGKETKIPLKELSKKDRDWVRNGGAAKGAANGAVTKPVGSRIVLRSYKALVDDSVFLADALKQQALAGAVPGFFVALTGGKPLDGFDITKPIVITIHVDEKGQPAGTLVAVPVQGKERFQKTLETVFPAKMTPKGRSFEIAMLGKGVFVKAGAGYFLLSDDADLVRSAAADPPAPVVVSDVAVESFNKAVAEEVRRAGLAQIDAMLSMAPLPPNLPEEAQRGRDEAMKMMRVMVERLTLDTDRSSFEATIDPTTKVLNVGFTIRATSGTPMAESFAAYGALEPRFVGAGRDDAHGWVGISVPTGAAMRGLIETSLGGAVNNLKGTLASAGDVPPEVTEAVAEIERQSKKLMASEHVEQEYVVAMEESGKPRMLMRWSTPGISEYFAAITKASTFDPTITTSAEGILSAPLPAASAAAMGPLGGQPVRIGAVGESMVLGFGCSETEPVKGMLTAASTGSALPPISARIDLAKLWPTMAKANPATTSLAEVVGEEGNLRADVGSLTDGIELRINADPGVLRLLGALGAAAAEAQGASGFPGAPPGFPGPGGPPAGILPPSIQGFPIPPVTPPGPPQAPAP
jgi:hypothetical protein